MPSSGSHGGPGRGDPGTATTVSNGQAGRWAAQAEPQQAAAAAPGPVAPDDDVAELQQLARLRDSGVITADDFEAKERQLLGL